MQLPRILLALVLTTLPLFAQKITVQPTAEISITCIAEPPKRRYTIVHSDQNSPLANQAIMLPPPPEQLPPTEIFYQCHGKTQTIRTAFNARNRFHPLPAQQPTTFHSSKSATSQTTLFSLPALAAGSRNFILLSPQSPKATNWLAPLRATHILLPPSSEHRCTIICANLSNQKIYLQLSTGEKITLLPQQQKHIPQLPQKNRVTLIAKAPHDQHICIQDSIPTHKARTHIYAFYPLTQKSPQRSIGTFHTKF